MDVHGPSARERIIDRVEDLVHQLGRRHVEVRDRNLRYSSPSR
jgi:hypothetical protein